MTEKELKKNYYRYAINSTMYSERQREFLLRLTEDLMKLNWARFLAALTKKSALDIGSGPGLFLEVLKCAGFESVTGVDRSEDCVAIINSANIKGIKCVCADAADFLAQTDNKFDLISAFHVIEHLAPDEVQPFLELCRDRLSDEGILLLETPNMNYPLASYHRWGDPTHHCAFTPGALKILLAAAGFECVEFGEKRNPVSSFAHRIRHALASVYLNIFYKSLILLLEGPRELLARMNIFSAYFWVVARPRRKDILE